MNRTQFFQVLRKLEQKMTDIYKSQIKKQKLIKTGRMYGSTKCKLKWTDKQIAFEIHSTDYFVFVDDKEGITKNVLKTTQFKSLKKDLIKAETAYRKYEVIRLSNQ